MCAAQLCSATSTPSCSGRAALKYNHLRHIVPLRQIRVSLQRANTSAVHALYNFTDSAEVRIPGQRRNRGQLKKEAREIMDVVRGLTSMTAKQLGAVSHLLPPGTVDAVGIAARLPRSNQGRKRQEGLIAKMLRGQLTEQQMDKLEAAVVVATEHQGIYDDGDVSGLVEVWREGLLEGDQAVVAEVYGYPATWGPDHQQLRAVVRQCQQALEAERSQGSDRPRDEISAESPVAGFSSSSSSSSSSSTDVSHGGDDPEEDLAAILAEAAARSGAGRGSAKVRGLRKHKTPEPPSRALIRTLGKMLRPLATRVVQEGSM
ncbi:hypothetical protein Vretimale_11497 [Volvox reticuliferus]|uniref:Uncharacterized protein n=1 Tax=Volvox reticuliferus TaxID=1737510 RepID=A0A8J4LR08_9CHLO|nr:hypothetical protein Vretifemale_14894 [Volvox reticuliferus]GIM07399.1 hypothetical protein Vretimale_11497 [Volvox reticuliferus]